MGDGVVIGGVVAGGVAGDVCFSVAAASVKGKRHIIKSETNSSLILFKFGVWFEGH